MYLEFKEERDRDFMNAYKIVIAQFGQNARLMQRSELIKATVNHSAQRYYVSYEQSTRIIVRMLKGKKVLFKNPLKKEMYHTILAKLKEKIKGEDTSVHDLIAQIIYSQAPRFYISEKSASILLYTLLKNKLL